MRKPSLLILSLILFFIGCKFESEPKKSASELVDQAPEKEEHLAHVQGKTLGGKDVDTSEFNCYIPFSGVANWDTMIHSTFMVDSFMIETIDNGLDGSNQVIDIKKFKGVVKETSAYKPRGNPRTAIESDCTSRLFPDISSKNEAFYSDKHFYIPFTLSYDLFESCLITVWEYIDENHIKYKYNIKNIIPIKYSIIIPTHKFAYDAKEYMIVEMRSAEEGEYAIATSLYEIQDSTIIDENYLSTISGNVNSGIIKVGRTKVVGDSISVYEQIWSKKPKANTKDSLINEERIALFSIN